MENIKKYFLSMMDSAVLRSIFRVGIPKTDREKTEATISSFFLHVHPAKIHPNSIKWNYTFGLGLISLILFLILCFTGVFLMFYYIPSIGDAYPSMKDIIYTTTFGPFIRNIHRWSAHGMVFVVFLHMCRVFYTAAYKKPREFNWVVGVILLILTLGLSFTGYLLPWDQLAFWAITVGSSIASYAPLIGEKIRWLMLGGPEVGQAALIRFYALHVIFLPALALLLVFFHLWRVRKDGGLSRAEGAGTNQINENESTKTYGLMTLIKGQPLKTGNQSNKEIFSWPNLFLIEITLFFGVILLVSLLGLFANAPLEELANPGHPTNPAKAPWYFLWLQEMVSYSAFIGGVLVPGILVGALVALPYLNTKTEGVGYYFHKSRKIAITVFTVIVILIVILTVVGTYFRGPNWSLRWWPH